MPDLHHKYGPSSLPHRAICPGWDNEKKESTFADEGDLMHAAYETGDHSKLNPEQSSCVKLVEDYSARLEKNAITVLREKQLALSLGRFGTADRVIVRMKEGRKHLDIIDAKFGRIPVTDAEVNLQGWDYLDGAWELFPDVSTATVHFLLPRQNTIDTANFTKADRPRMKVGIKLTIERVEEFERTQNEEMLNPTAENCLYCRNLGKCAKTIPLFLTTAKKYAPLEIVEPHSSKVTDPGQMASLYAAARVMERMCESVKKHAMELALANGGILCDASGKVLFEVKEREGNRAISDIGLAMPVLGKHLDDRELLSVSKVSLPDALKLISAKAKRGEKAKLMAQVAAELEELDAVTSGSPVRYLKKVHGD